ncbi:hypothetical protein ACFO3S_25735 [Cohnella hongkongensis]|uniref:Uncharacterized protein n=1 Tax=Cohnella hongkongensis TaxID=178337 RepID=A0ABV9FI55_9BACL
MDHPAASVVVKPFSLMPDAIRRGIGAAAIPPVSLLHRPEVRIRTGGGIGGILLLREGLINRLGRIRLGEGSVELRLRHLLDLPAQVGYLIQLLNRGLVPLQRGLNRLGGSLLPLGNLFQTLRVLLLLLKKHLVILAGLLRLMDQLLNDLLALVQGLAPLRIGIVQGETLLWIGEPDLGFLKRNELFRRDME